MVKMQITTTDCAPSNLENDVRVIDDFGFGRFHCQTVSDIIHLDLEGMVPTEFDAVFALPCKRFHGLARIAILISSIVGDVCCDGFLLNHVCSLRKGHCAYKLNLCLVDR
jgi:hypothetical protein